MIDRNDKEFGPIEISAGILFGTVLAGLIDMAITGQTWNEVFENDALLMGFAGVVGSFLLYIRKKRKTNNKGVGNK